MGLELPLCPKREGEGGSQTQPAGPVGIEGPGKTFPHHVRSHQMRRNGKILSWDFKMMETLKGFENGRPYPYPPGKLFLIS